MFVERCVELQRRFLLLTSLRTSSKEVWTNYCVTTTNGQRATDQPRGERTGRHDAEGRSACSDCFRQVKATRRGYQSASSHWCECLPDSASAVLRRSDGYRHPLASARASENPVPSDHCAYRSRRIGGRACVQLCGRHHCRHPQNHARAAPPRGDVDHDRGLSRFAQSDVHGLALAVVGASLLARTWWPLILLPAALLAVRQLAIEPEERYLTEHFGSLYTDYQVRVRRWL